ncbi:hypothetical protein [Flavobacterium sp. C4GT6]|uniref:hypothetical protein n=1 Tax=Flavobacterium sp. C4GT6 TaxID=3103818 RepID=UPI002ED321BE
MFWNKKYKPTVTPEDKEWIEGELLFIKESLLDKNAFNELDIILPTKQYYNLEFNGTEENARHILEQTKIFLNIDDENIKLKFVKNFSVKMDNRRILTSSSKDIYGTSNDYIGSYNNDNGETTIYIENELLKSPYSLISTIAYELCYHILLSKEELEESNGYLTELFAIVYGFGIFIGNSRFSYSITKNSDLSTLHETSSTGYLPEEVAAYAMAWLSVYRNENTDWKKFLNKSMLKYFEQNIQYIENNRDKVAFE